ncbi:MAG TPA: biopolymer transporter ExbD [Candidatus Babeliales bacterium]|nr:biopolymer transporter ExbD [Candidatus Babeliales bacterium]
MSTINITPFTDVLLVLLIIFIILASVTKEPRLPDAYNKEKVQPSQIVVIIDEHDHVQIGSNTVTIAEAKAAFAQLQDATDHRFKSVIVKADPKSSYGVILQVMDAAKSVDLTDFGLANHVQGTPEGTVAQ